MDLGPGTGSPAGEPALMRLGTGRPFERVPRELAALLGVTRGRETVRRRTEAAGAALVAAATAAVAALGRTGPAPPPGGDAWYEVSVDGAMVPLVPGEWGAVQTRASAQLERQPTPAGPWTVRATALSDFSRRAEADTCRQRAWVETPRRGITLAPRVGAVGAGAPWCQRFYAWHCPAAGRILDWAQAVA
ncbi:MAG TPA: hypothetical protein VII06_13715 [Chloroflexota bacterium]